MASSYESDPTKELNEMIEVLLPQVTHRLLDKLKPISRCSMTQCQYHHRAQLTIIIR